MENHDIQLPDYWRIIRKRKWNIFYTFCVIMLSTVVFTDMQTPIYETTLEIKVDKKSTEPSLTSTGFDNLSTEIQEIKSLTVMGKVVERIDVLPLGAQDRDLARYSLARQYQNNISIEQIPETNIISISVKSTDPDKAVLLANAMVDVYMEESVSGGDRQARAVLEYTRKRQDELEEKIKSGEKELQNIQYVENIFTLTPEVKSTLDRMDVPLTLDFENEMLKVDKQIDGMDKLIRQRQDQGQMSFLSDVLSNKNFIFEGLKKDLLQLEFKRYLLLVDYTTQHPFVIEQDHVITETKKKIVSFIKDSLKVQMTPEREEDLSLVLNKLFLGIKREVLFRIINKSYGQSGALSTDQLQYVDLQRAVSRSLEDYKRISDKMQDAELSLASQVTDISVVSRPTTPREPIRPNKKVNYLMGFLVGTFFGLMLAFVLESMDMTIGTIEGVEKLLELPVLGIIPFIRTGEGFLNLNRYYKDQKEKEQIRLRERLVTVFHQNAREAESFRQLRTNVIEQMKDAGKKIILITSSERQEGKSTISSNLAVSIAQIGKKTLLIEANLRRPTISELFGISRQMGLAEILMGKCTWQKAVKTSMDILVGQMDIHKALEVKGIDNLHLITCGQKVDHPAEILNSSQLDSMFKELKNNFDVIFVDCPPIMPVPDSVILGSKVDGVVVVYKVGVTKKETLKRACLQLKNVKATIIGLVFNQLNMDAQVGMSSYQRYYGESNQHEGNIFQRIIRRFGA